MKTFFEAHIWTLRGKLYRMAYLWVKEKEVANDLLQSVFEKAWQRREALQKMDNPTGWMVRSLKNECLQHFKASKKFEPLNEEEREEEVLEVQETDEKVKMVFQFLETLPEKQREIFQLREVEGLMYEEIGEYLEISLEQVKVNLHRARKTLREFLMQKKNER
ncbi:RNA polymerase sigma factor [Rhodonellum psychrophilum GCM71 = DSM 17998]|uniref:RNA polymerase sigma factor n=2 Tax=Rhodonellum TaxID=336827 RepID=U5C117_9BACT|nr:MULTISPECIES: sigma-70 family RNA polymerase sigma factor [Rhodonellum]ERM83499.1 RNA polymerase sigma factor [Rhodonellum psychrophilum GCM71 = DSM 17998]SDY51304.1 RNA polymerase sigma-70 factor, ECF subfamily [Rhodonellum ikkaensis]